MQRHYFSTIQTTPSHPFEIRVKARGRDLCLLSDRGVFSASELDRGTRLLLESVDILPGQSVLDLGCGYGVIGVFAGLEGAHRVIMVDVNARAVGLARHNAASHGLSEVALAIVADGGSALADGWADWCLMNPPIRAGRTAVTRLIEEGSRCLRPGGRLALVARTSQGVRRLERVMQSVLSNVGELAKGGGFRVVCGTAP